MYGWTGKTLVVDLTAMQHRVVQTEALEAFIGGRGWAAQHLFHTLQPGADPLGPENLLILSTGPLTGTLFPAAGRLVVTAKSAVTGGYGSANGGGHFAPEIKYAGFDHIVISGTAERPVYLAVLNDSVAIRDASRLWGRSTWETEDEIRAELHAPAARVAAIGPAGENLTRVACVIVDKGRSASWSGCGAVMGAKKLKAVAVLGTGAVRVARPEAFMAEVRRAWNWIRGTKAMRQMAQYGTLGVSGMDGILTGGPQGVRNLSEGQWDGARTLGLKETVFKELYDGNRVACFGCPTPCIRSYRIPPRDGREAASCIGIHANTVRAFGPNLDVDTPETVVRATQLVGQLGIDLDAATAAVAWAFEAWEKGLLGPADTGGLVLGWGQGEALLTLLHQMAHRQGFGAVLADGVAAASRQIGRGTEAFALSIKGTGLNEKGLREYVGWTLGIATSTRGAGHLNGAPLCEDRRLSPALSRTRYGIDTAFTPGSYEGKEYLVLLFEKLKAAIDSLGLCYFQSYWYDEEIYGFNELAAAYSAATGQEVDGPGLALAGERIYNVEKAFNTLHATYGRADDIPPDRFFDEPVTLGRYKGAVLDRRRWDELLQRYYAAHGWDPATGLQTQTALHTLGLEDVAAKLAEHGRLLERQKG